LGSFAVGLFFDSVAGAYVMVVPLVCITLLPDTVLRTRFQRWFTLSSFFVFVYVLLFAAASEWFFWDEFGVRFNFIAVDYLVYTHEVIGNIWESYPLLLILSGLLGGTAVVLYGVGRTGYLTNWLRSRMALKRRLCISLVLLGVPVVCALTVSTRIVPSFRNSYNRELAQNGLYALVAAFRANALDYETFYQTLDPHLAFATLRPLIKADNATFLSDSVEDVMRLVESPGPEKRWNVIQITVESLSPKYLGAFGDSTLTPNLDALAADSLLFTNFYATGTRTVRGMEALTLSIPPTPGRSVVKRPGNEDLFTLGAVFQSRGYQTTFLYSGHGYFDNMNYFFSHNGFKTVDRASKPEEAITFANVWGACDGDLYNWVIEEADLSYAAEKPFFHFVMTTSNHRPYTFPEGTIDLPCGHRGGAVKYTDYAIGEFLRKARSKPWFKNTLVVIVADHCGSSAGETELPLDKYRIPLLVYNPDLVKPGRVNTLCCQMDFAPTLLGLLNWTYRSRFFGKDILRMKPDQGRALLGNYQTLGYLMGNHLAVLKPGRKSAGYAIDPATGEPSPCRADATMIREAIAYYQTANHLLSHGMYRKIDEQ
ncbi:MAG: LTA synthase family protein, partial [Lentisphaerae bacterium]|nr:LTA synthase family protein [Lentisphaerota bacterium]